MGRPRAHSARGSVVGRTGAAARRRVQALSRVVLYTAAGCHVCDRARRVLEAEGVDYDEVDIGGDAVLEGRYREWLPVVEIDGERAFVYWVQPDALRRKLASSSPGGAEGDSAH